MSPKPARAAQGPRPVPIGARTAGPARRPSRATPSPRSGGTSVTTERQAWILVPLRAFLGITFVYAGLQKLADRWFFKAAAPSSLQAQLRGAVRTSPIGGLIGGVSHHAVLLGLLIAFAELAVGLGTLLGLWARVAAAGGLVLSLGFLLTVSWHSRPYYYGADVVFLFAWTPLLIGGAGRLSADAVAAARARTDLRLPPATPVTIGFESVQRLCGYYDRGRCAAQGERPCGPEGCPVLASPEPARTAEVLDRRTFVTRAGWAGWATVSALLAGGFAATAGRLIAPRRGAARPPSLAGPARAVTTAPGTTAPVPTTAGSAPAAPSTAAPVAGTRLGPAATVPVGGAASFSDPTTGDPAYVVQPSRGRFLAFDAICPHQGCTVQFTGSQFQCPCHGAVFDATNGSVLQGPAQRPLAAISIHVGPDGQLYVQ